MTMGQKSLLRQLTEPGRFSYSGGIKLAQHDFSSSNPVLTGHNKDPIQIFLGLTTDLRPVLWASFRSLASEALNFHHSTSVSRPPAHQAFSSRRSMRPKRGMLHFLRASRSKGGGYFCGSGEADTLSLPAPVQEAWLCHAPPGCWGHLFGFLNRKESGRQSEGVWSVTVERG